MERLDLPEVRRVGIGLGSHVEPPANEAWPDSQLLAWHAAVCAVDTGLSISVRTDGHEYAIGVYGPGISTGTSPMTYKRAWSYLSGVTAGAQAVRGGPDAQGE